MSPSERTCSAREGIGLIICLPATDECTHTISSAAQPRRDKQDATLLTDEPVIPRPRMCSLEADFQVEAGLCGCRVGQLRADVVELCPPPVNQWLKALQIVTYSYLAPLAHA